MWILLARRLFLVEVDPKELTQELRQNRVNKIDEFNIIETFIPAENQKLIQLLSSSKILRTEQSPLDQRWAKGEFSVRSKGWKLEKDGPRVEISKDDYYSLLLGNTNAAVEQKVRTVFNLGGRRFSLEMNLERNYSVIQVDYEGDYGTPFEQLFSSLSSVDVIGELFMSLEETFCRLYLKNPVGIDRGTPQAILI